MLKGLLRVAHRSARSDNRPAADEKLRNKADDAWRDIVASQEPLEVEPRFKGELNRIVEATREVLA